MSIFVGRNVELDRLLNPQIRVAAITGLGGEGKSTLAAKFFEMAVNGQTKVPFTHFGWCDCKDLETPFHQKLLTLLEELTERKQGKVCGGKRSKYCTSVRSRPEQQELFGCL